VGATDTPAIDKAELDREFTELYERHLRDVYSFLYYRLGNHHDAEDVSEQVFLQAYRHLPKALAESNGRSLRPWLIRIAQNLAINLYRDRSRKPVAPLDAAGEFATTHDTEDLVESREQLDEVLAKVAELPDDRREALIMRFALGMDNGEIARAMGKTEGATKVLLHRAIKQLEQAIAEDERVGAAR
jgi:RNA polymerase sigma-70 factor (ECF subfamily)